MKRTIEKEKEVLEEFDEDVRISDLNIRQDSEGNLFAVGPNKEKALKIKSEEGRLVAEKAVLNVETTEKVANTEGLEESEYYLEKKESSEGESQIILVEPIQRGDDHVFLPG